MLGSHAISWGAGQREGSAFRRALKASTQQINMASFLGPKDWPRWPPLQAKHPRPFGVRGAESLPTLTRHWGGHSTL